jgi:hypothetical protein
VCLASQLPDKPFDCGLHKGENIGPGPSTYAIIKDAIVHPFISTSDPAADN